MDSYRVIIRPETAFSTPLKGDTLFGQLCWMIREKWGNERLETLLQDYTRDKPFMICSDAFPTGHIPRPEYPLISYDKVEGDRKQIKRKHWLASADISAPVKSWLGRYKNDGEVGKEKGISQKMPQQHNSINRQTGTTTGEAFTPYQAEQIWYHEGISLDIWVLIDHQRFNKQELEAIINMMGQTGYGKDASIGLGKFSVLSVDAESLYAQEQANTAITLAPSILSQQGFDTEQCFYSVFTRFGRHGVQALSKGKPFKNPILMADTAAVVVAQTLPDAPYIGKGIGGSQQLSYAIPETVHQGYAPCIKIRNEGLMT